MPPMERMKTNVAALEVLRTLLREGRDATPAERATMGKLRGWGGINVPNTYEAKYRKFDLTPLQKQLVEIIDELDPDGKKGLLESLNTAALTSYYTPIPIAQAMHSVAEMAGYKGGGTMLDPSMGNGVFEGTMKKGVQQSTQIRGCELDWLTGQIAKRLYPDARVNGSGFQDAHVPENYYDYVVSNIPFGSLQVTDLEWEKNPSPIRKAAQGKIHNYFAVKMVESTRPGGLCVIMTSNAIMDTQGNAPIRKYIADNCEILGAVRLPNNTFKGAGTRVVTDVIYLRKFRDESDRLTVLDNGDYNDKVLTPFLTVNGKKLADRIGSTKEVKYNSYFQVNPQNVVGEIMAGGQYSDDAFDLRSEYSTDELAKQFTKLGKKFIDQRKKRFGDTIYGTTVKRPQIAEAVKYKNFVENQKAEAARENKSAEGQTDTETHKRVVPNIKEMSDTELYEFLGMAIRNDKLFTDPNFGRQTLTDLYNVNERRIGAAFSQGNGLTDFVREIRIEYACWLFNNNPEMTISEVSAACGFSSLPVFSREFKRKLDVTPSYYRSQI